MADINAQILGLFFNAWAEIIKERFPTFNDPIDFISASNPNTIGDDEIGCFGAQVQQISQCKAVFKEFSRLMKKVNKKQIPFEEAQQIILAALRNDIWFSTLEAIDNVNADEFRAAGKDQVHRLAIVFWLKCQKEAGLNLFQARLNRRSVLAITALLKTSSIPILNLKMTKIDNQDMCAISKGLSCDTALTSLNISGNRGGRYDSGIQAITNALIHHPALKKLIIGSQGLISTIDCGLADLLATNKTIETLKLSFNRIDSKGAEAIFNALQTNSDTALKKLDLTGNNIRSISFKAFAGAIKTVTELRLKKNPISKVGISTIAKALKTNTTLALLDLDDCSLDDSGVEAIFSSLNSNLDTGLTSLSLKFNNITDKGAQVIAAALKKNDKLTHIDLSENEISEAILDEIKAKLRENYSNQQSKTNNLLTSASSRTASLPTFFSADTSIPTSSAAASSSASSSRLDSFNDELKILRSGLFASYHPGEGEGKSSRTKRSNPDSSSSETRPLRPRRR